MYYQIMSDLDEPEEVEEEALRLSLGCLYRLLVSFTSWACISIPFRFRLWVDDMRRLDSEW